ncbi:peptide deformylase [Candidatus Gracilibacteria bacterium]|nr:peptide deformylase [Candidatus Gracilibacteria bacterium]
MLKIETGMKNEILRTVSEEIKKSELDSYIKLGKEMIKYIKNPKNGGVGLAAPQIGHNKRLIVVSLLKNWEDENYKTIMMINPKILSHSTETEIENEGCLSLPGEKGKVERFTEVKISFIDDKKKENILYLTKTQSRIVQHEIDHINGVLFMDKVIV